MFFLILLVFEGWSFYICNAVCFEREEKRDLFN
jgi:hypothetical protein